MTWYQWFSLISLALCLTILSFLLVRLIRLGRPKDFSKPTGDVASAVKYSFTGAMSPRKKESAYLHLPTYSAGILYHLGTFLCAGLFVWVLANMPIPSPLRWIFVFFLTLTGLSGLAILIKRGYKKELRHLSSPDDYLSNLLVTGLHLLSALVLWLPSTGPVYFVWTGLLLLYLPIGKLRHLLYFFAARYHLAYFYGWRNTWPPKKVDEHGST
jgi:hypothetical protein